MISIVIPTHNRPFNLINALKSVFDQSELPEEVIVVDDGSIPPVLDSIFDKSPPTLRCILVRNETPKGANYSRNRGVYSANCSFIAFLDDDDIFLPEKIQIAKYNIAQNESIDVFYHSALIRMVNEGVSYQTKPQKVMRDDIYTKLLCGNFIGGTPMVIIKRDALIKTGGFNNEMPALQDYELWIRLAKLKFKFYYIDQTLTLCNYYTGKKSISKSIVSNEIAVKLIYEINIDGFAKLTKVEQREYETWKGTNKIHKYLLNLDYIGSVKTQLGLFLYAKNFINLLRFLAVLCGPKFIFYLKGKGL